jgi:hypothetical protein
MIGTIDSVVNVPAAEQPYVVSSPPKMLVEIGHAGHYAFSNGCFPSPDCNPPTTLTQSEANSSVLRYVIPFLERYLGQRVDLIPLLGPPTGPASSTRPTSDARRLGLIPNSISPIESALFVKRFRLG